MAMGMLPPPMGGPLGGMGGGPAGPPMPPMPPKPAPPKKKQPSAAGLKNKALAAKLGQKKPGGK